MKRILSALLAGLMLMGILTGCSNDNSQTGSEETTGSGTTVDLKPVSETVIDGDFTVTLATSASVFKLEDIRSGKIDSLNYRLSVKYIGTEHIVIAHLPVIGIFDIRDADGNYIFGKTDVVRLYKYTQIQSGQTATQTYSGKKVFDDEAFVAGEYYVVADVFFSTSNTYFGDDYYSGSPEYIPTDAQKNAEGKDYSFTIKIPLTIE